MDWASFLANRSYHWRYPGHGLFDSVCAYTTNDESHSCGMLSRVKIASVPFKNVGSAYVLFLLIRFVFTTQSKNQIKARSLFYNALCLKSLINEKEWPPASLLVGVCRRTARTSSFPSSVLRSTAPKLKLIRRIKWGTYFFFNFQWVTIVLNGSTQLCNTSNSLWQWCGHPRLVVP